MSKETIPQSIIDKINKEYPEVKGLEWQDCHKKQREAAIWGYGLSEGRIKELEAVVAKCYQYLKENHSEHI